MTISAGHKKEKFVYFIRPVGMDGPIKIGCSSNPEIRCNHLLYWSPFDLEVLARLPGDEILEARFHRKFLDSHERFEWFRWSEGLQCVVDAVASDKFDVDTLPPYTGPLRGMAERIKSYTGIDYEYLLLHKRVVSLADWRWRTGKDRLRSPSEFKKLNLSLKKAVIARMRASGAAA